MQLSFDTSRNRHRTGHPKAMSAFGVSTAGSETFGSEAACANWSATTGNASVNASSCKPAWDECSVIPPESIYFYPFRKFLLAPLMVLALLGNVAILVGVARVRGISRSTRMYYALIAVAELVVTGTPDLQTRVLLTRVLIIMASLFDLLQRATFSLLNSSRSPHGSGSGTAKDPTLCSRHRPAMQPVNSSLRVGWRPTMWPATRLCVSASSDSSQSRGRSTRRRSSRRASVPSSSRSSLAQ